MALRMPRKGGCAIPLLVTLLLGGMLAAAQDYSPLPFAHQGYSYVAYFTPVTYLDAVATCATTTLLRNGAQGALLPIGRMPNLLVELQIDDESVAVQLVQTIADVTSRQNPPEQEQWDVWAYDDYRLCRAATYIPENSETFFMSGDKPCNFTLCYLCVEEASLQRLNITSSSAWYRDYQAAAAPSPSPYALGPGPSPNGSGLQLLSGDLVIGDLQPPSSSVFFNDSGLFWTSGPVVTSFYRGGSHPLYTMRPVRQGEQLDLWRMFRSQNITGNVFGVNNQRLDQGSTWEVYFVGQDYNDYIVAVQGCYRSSQVELLYFITRTNRQYQLGRGGCTTRFREDAPPGGYLAGFAGAYMNASLWTPGDPPLGPPGEDFILLKQLRLVWAAPVGSPPPTYSVVGQSQLGLQQACPTARPLVTEQPGQGPGECGVAEGAVCYSNTCCGDPYVSPANSSVQYRICGTGRVACQTNCIPGYGLCGALPESSAVQFVRTSPRSNVTSAYYVQLESELNYTAALGSCGESTYMGLTWRLPTIKELIDLVVSMDTRRGAYVATASNRYWVWVNESYVSLAPDVACMRGAYGINRDGIMYDHMFYLSSCASTSKVMCVAEAPPLRPGASGVPGNVSANPSAVWKPGNHVVTVSRTYGAGPLDGSCRFLTGEGLEGQPLLPTTLQTNSTTGTIVLSFTRQLQTIAVSSALQPSNETDPAGLVAGLQLQLATAPNAEPAVGVPTSGGWRELELSDGEVVVGVSGCAGGFVERLVFRTNRGRVWTHDFGSTSLCSVAFSEAPPSPEAYLVGLQGSYGRYLEGVQFLWGAPAPQPPPPQPLPGDDGLSGGQVAGIVVGSVVGGLLLLALLVGLAVYGRRRATAGRSGAAGKGLELAGGGAAPQVVVHHASDPSTAAAYSAVATICGSAVAGAAKVGPVSAHDTTEATPPVSSQGTGSIGASSSDAKPSPPRSATATGSGGTTPPYASGSAGPSEAPSSAPAAGTLLEGARPLLGSSDTAALGSSLGKAAAGQNSLIIDVEEGLSAYIKASKAELEDDDEREGAGADAGCAAKSAMRSGALASRRERPPRNTADIAAAISVLQAELAGRQDEQLRISNVIAKGSIGTVYLGTWRGLRVAIKTVVVHDALMGKEGRQRQQAILEAAISTSLQHPNVVTTYSYDVKPLAAVETTSVTPMGAAMMDAEGRPVAPPTAEPGSLAGLSGDVFKLYIIQEFCDVGSLGSALLAGVVGSVAAGGAASLCALTLALDVACGMAHIHAKNIVHGDLSAGNVLLASSAPPPEVVGKPRPHSTFGPFAGHDPSPVDLAIVQILSGYWRPPVAAKVADFGLSVAMGEGQTHASNKFQGTPAYAAPELLSRGRLTRASDVWSFGVLLLELMHGEGIVAIRQRAGAGADSPDSSMGAEVSVAGGPRPAWMAPPPGCPPRLCALLDSCLAVDDAARPAFTTLVHSLAELVRDEHVAYRNFVQAQQQLAIMRAQQKQQQQQ